MIVSSVRHEGGKASRRLVVCSVPCQSMRMHQPPMLFGCWLDGFPLLLMVKPWPSTSSSCSHAASAKKPAPPGLLPPHHPCLATARVTPGSCRPRKPGDVARQRGDLQRQGTIMCCLCGERRGEPGGRKRRAVSRSLDLHVLESRRMTTRDLAPPRLGSILPRVVCVLWPCLERSCWCRAQVR